MNTAKTYRTLIRKLRAHRLNVEREIARIVGDRALHAVRTGGIVTNRELSAWERDAKEDLIVVALRAEVDRLDYACSGLEVRATRFHVQLG